MVIQGAFINVDKSVTADRFLKSLAREVPGGHYFVAQPPPGIIMTAALDWRVIVPDGDPVDALANALWSGYESMVKPLQSDASGRSPAICMQMKNIKGQWDRFTIGRDIDKKDAFLHRVRETASVLSSRNSESAVGELEKTANSEYWLEIRRP